MRKGLVFVLLGLALGQVFATTPEAVDAAGTAQFRRMVEASVPGDAAEARRVATQLARITALDLAAENARAARFSWESALLQTRTPTLAALPGGKVYASTAWLAQVKPDDDELAAALATQVAALLLEQPLRVIELRSATPPQDEALLQLRRRNLLEADALAVKLLRRAGIAPAKLASVVGRSHTTLGIDGGAAWGTLPPKAQRLAALEAAITATADEPRK